ncbi:ribokinase [Virgibacillus sp. C22-A2]|uniref:Ribokinase n=1 Tax=Virgibacillus tibetensis TaxID=3042313 RepID=A0ABU6KJI1_9BACI|nr:ribokinase [Virgibacillus sp. C22-A2]
MNSPIITVIGSINTDMVTVTESLPNQGETVIGDQFKMKPGGKGANQAVAAARLGANVQMIGKVGQDQNGADMLKALKKENVSIRMVETAPKINTGIANIILSNNDNRIIIVPGANDKVTPEYVSQFKEDIRNSDLVLIQFEIPVDTIIYCLDLCNEYNIPIIVNPAPAKKIASDYWSKATYITPNESEYTQLFDFKDRSSGFNDKLIVTKGAHGVSYSMNDEYMTLPAYSVNAVDTTGAGDTFNGALAVALSEKKPISTSIKFANAASALSIQKFGAQDGMPTRTEVESFLRK